MEYIKKVSIITPMIVNDTIYLNNYLKSIKEQVYENIEVILIHPKDNEISNIINEFKELNIRTIEISETTGIGEARNLGIKNSTGDYLYFLDIDDCMHEHTIHCLVESAHLKNADVVFGKLKYSSTRPTNNQTYSVLLNRLLESRINNAKDITSKLIRFKCNNILFSRELIIDNNIEFLTNINNNNDMQFTALALDLSNNVIYDADAVCFKIRRSDTVRYPSMTNRYQDDILIEYPKAYRETAEKLSVKPEIKRKLDKAFNSKYNRDISSIYTIKSDKERIDTLTEWAKAYSLVDMDNISSKRKLVKKVKLKEINELKQFNFAGTARIAKTRVALRKFRKFYSASSKTKLRRLYQTVFTKHPVKKDHILYESFLGKNMSDSPKYIYKYLSEKYPGRYKHIWVFNETRENLPSDVIQVKRFSLKHLYYIAVSKFWVSNMRQPKWYVKRDEQIFLSCWHGTPLKKLVFDMDEVHSANKNYKQDFYEQSRAWDYLISANRYSTDIFKSAFLFDNPILELGYPRNDLLHSENKDEIARELKEKLGIPLDKKVVLYAPTWRDDEFYKPGQYKFKLKLDLERLRRELGDEYFFVLRTHYFIADHLDVEGAEDIVYNASKYDDITELYLLADVLITDYSSVFFDYANLKRPIMFFTYDLDKYRDTLRGFYLDMETECPGPMVMNNDELIEKLKDFDKLKEDYKDNLEEFYDRFCYLDDGKASERIAEEIIVKNS